MSLPTVARPSALMALGLTKHQIAVLVREGSYRRIGHGWLAAESVPDWQRSVLARGLRPTCVSAAKLHGLWTPLYEGVHVFRRRGSEAVLGPGMLRHLPEPRAWPDDEPLAPLATTLRHAVSCVGVADAAILFESAWNLKLLDMAEIASILLTLPKRYRRPLMRLRSTAESGTETRVRWWFEARGIAVRSQVRVPVVGRVDLLVGQGWVIECDSRAHHTGTERYAEDRRRDLELRRLGYLVTRLTWDQVFLAGASTRTALWEILQRGEHRRDLSPGAHLSSEPSGVLP